jgi:predicted transcriptional regulator
MPKYPSTLSPIKLKSEQHDALKRVAETDQTSIGTIVRKAIADYLEKRGIPLSS